jgi:hypothetical protein
MENSIFFVVCLLLAGKSMAQPTTNNSGQIESISDGDALSIAVQP